MSSIERIPLPLPRVGSVNAWLLRGEPLTLLDTGPRSDEALAALERGLRARGVRIEDIELVLGTHHHHDHVGLAATIARRSDARVAVLAETAEYAGRYPEHVAADRLFARELMRANGVPQQLWGRSDELWDYIGDTAESFHADIRLAEGDTIRAAGRDLRVFRRPGHSASDTLFVDSAARLAFVGDHVLAKITPNTEISATADPQAPRSRSRVDYLDALRHTAAMPLGRLLTGHGPPVHSATAVLRRQLSQHRHRCKRICRILERGPADAFALARTLWSEAVVREQPLLVVWEVLGHLDLLLAAGVAAERVADDGCWRYSLALTPRKEHRPHGTWGLAHAG
jgi:glyoxylase-like metal-dependent hydrolase (beta-lactamase superfamily II)